MNEEDKNTVIEEQQNSGPVEGIDHADGNVVHDQQTDDNQDPQTQANETSEEVEQLSPLEAAIKESNEFKDAWQRERAEFSNYRKRMMMEKTRIRADAAGVVIHDFLEALDNLDRVLVEKSEIPEVNNFIEGVKMIKGQFINVLNKHNVEVVSPLNMAFEPSKMEAIASEESNEYEAETVIEVFQDGYVHNLDSGPHVLRPARVKVGKPTKTKNDQESSQ